MYALATSTGKLVWMFATQGAVESSPAISDKGCVVFGSWDNSTYCVC